MSDRFPHERRDNSDKIILDLCGGTGAWSKPYREAGYDVRLITLPDYDVTDVVFSGDYMVFNKQTYEINDMGIKYANVYGILAAPPCTEFSIAKGSKPRDMGAGMEVVEACLKIVWRCRLAAG
jgi:site-specific DNA-cytosine methylase